MKKIVALLAVLALCLSASALAESATLSVRGTGVVKLDAESAVITLGVREVSKDVATAQASVNEKIASVIAKLKEMGIASSDIHTNSISIYPDYNYDDASNPVVGYTAENSISVETSDIDNVGKYIDAAFEAGANTFSDISFSAKEMTAENNEALELAIQHAFAKAEVMAKAADMKLGGVIAISEADYSYPDGNALYKAEQAADAGAGTEVYASPLQVSATVTVQFELNAVD